MRIMSLSAVIRIGVFVAAFASFHSQAIAEVSKPSACLLPLGLKKEIHSQQSHVDEIVRKATQEVHYGGQYYKDLLDFTDEYGNRLAGSKVLEKAIDRIIKLAKSNYLQARGDPFRIPRWVRGNESAYLIQPEHRKLSIVGLGFSGATPPEGITAELMVVSDFDELKKRRSEVKGKIVLFNAEYTTYGKTAVYRSKGPNEASKLGAVAALVRSITPFSIDSPHAGMTNFESSVKHIPAAAVTLEDADYLARMHKKGKVIKLLLHMDDHLLGTTETRNIIIDLPGEQLPDEYVVVSGHIDSWDNGRGALDDGVGAFLALHTNILLRSIGVPPPKRTIRAILWSAEEIGLLGAKAHLKNHREEINKWTMVLESDGGSYTPLGLNVEGNNDALCILQEIVSMLKGINATTAVKTTGVGSDISVFKNLVPLGEPYYAANNYFWYHHTSGDSMRTLNSKIMDRNLALFAATSYVLSNLSIRLPRGNEKIEDLLNDNYI